MRAVLEFLRVFFRGAYLSYIAHFRWIRPPNYIASKIIMPLNQILFFSLLGRFATGPDSVPFYAIGNAMQIVALNGTYGTTMSIGGERWSGTLIYLFGSPAHRLAMFLGRGFMHVIDGMVGVVLGLMWAGLLLGVDYSRTDLAALGATILVTTLSVMGFGLLLGAISLITVNIMFVNNTVYFLLLVFAGANVPLANFPEPIQAFSYSLPLTRGILAARAVVEGSGLPEIAPLLSGELLVGGIYLAIGYLSFSLFETIAKRRGTLEAF